MLFQLLSRQNSTLFSIVAEHKVKQWERIPPFETQNKQDYEVRTNTDIRTQSNTCTISIHFIFKITTNNNYNKVPQMLNRRNIRFLNTCFLDIFRAILKFQNTKLHILLSSAWIQHTKLFENHLSIILQAELLARVQSSWSLTIVVW
jgi:hypothetical protein